MSAEADKEMSNLRQSMFDALKSAGFAPESKNVSITVKKKHVGKIAIQSYYSSVTGYERIHLRIITWDKTEYGGLADGNSYTIEHDGPTGIWNNEQNTKNTVDRVLAIVTEFTNRPPVLKTKAKEPDEREQLVQNLITRLVVEKCGGKLVRLAQDDGDVTNMTHPWASRIRVSSEWIKISWIRANGWFSHVDIKYNKFTIDPEHIVGKINTALHKVNNLMTNIDATFRELGQCTTTATDMENQ